jgi:hypothetical protein
MKFDVVRTSLNNAVVFEVIARGTVLPLAVSFLIFGSGLAPLHAHESDSPHPHAVVHSHFEPHTPLTHRDSEPEVDHPEHIVWLDLAVVHALPFQLDAPAAALTPVADPVMWLRRWSAIAVDKAAPPHGPPRAIVSLRAPPAFPA